MLVQVSWNSTCRRQFVDKDGIAIAVRCARWRPDDPSWHPRQEAQLVRSNPSFVRGIAGNAQSLISVASQNLGEQQGEGWRVTVSCVGVVPPQHGSWPLGRAQPG